MPRADTTFDLDIEHLLLDSVTGHAIHMLDPQGCILSWNAGGERINGYTDAEIIGCPVSMFYTEEDRTAGEPERALQHAREHGQHESEGWRLRKDGSRFRANVVIDPVWRDGTLLGFAEVTRDVTQRYEAQRELEQAGRSLAEAQKVHAIGKLTLGVAHDFNNLLTVIVNSLDLLSAMHTDERSTRLIRASSQAAERGSRLSRQMLAFSRAQDLQPGLHDLNELVTRSMERYRQVAGPIVCCEARLASALPRVMVDPDELEAALMNLVSNARDVLSSGTILMTTGRCAAPKDAMAGDADATEFVCVTVRDAGPGMREDVRARAMEPFFTTKDIGRGSGLGLSQVYGFATQSGGSVFIDSEEGRGTSVTIAFPVARDPQ